MVPWVDQKEEGEAPLARGWLPVEVLSEAEEASGVLPLGQV